MHISGHSEACPAVIITTTRCWAACSHANILLVMACCNACVLLSMPCVKNRSQQSGICSCCSFHPMLTSCTALTSHNPTQHVCHHSQHHSRLRTLYLLLHHLLFHSHAMTPTHLIFHTRMIQIFLCWLARWKLRCARCCAACCRWPHACVFCCTQEVFGRIIHTKLSSDRCIQACIINIADWGGDVRDRVVRALSAIHRSYDNAKVNTAARCIDASTENPFLLLS